MGNAVRVLHGEIAEGSLSITSEIVGSEVVRELLYEGGIVVESVWNLF